MKRIIKFPVLLLFVGLCAYNVNFMTNDSAFSVTDLKLVLGIAHANTETAGCPCTPYDFDDHLMHLKTCIPFIWQQKLKCKPASTNKCCKAGDQKPCSGGYIVFPPAGYF